MDEFINLIKYITKNITGEDMEVVVSQEGDRSDLAIKAPADYVGLLIGKGGATIKNIRRIVKIKASLENKYVNVFVEEN